MLQVYGTVEPGALLEATPAHILNTSNALVRNVSARLARGLYLTNLKQQFLPGGIINWPCYNSENSLIKPVLGRSWGVTEFIPSACQSTDTVTMGNQHHQAFCLGKGCLGAIRG